MMKKRILAFFLCIALCIGFIPSGALVQAEDVVDASSEDATNVVILESLLHERSWVLETLVDNDYSNNPYIIYSAISGGKSMMSDTLARYKDESNPNYSATYKFLVDVMEKLYSAEDYLGGLASHLVDFFFWFGDEDSASGVIKDLTASTDELRYESIMYEVLGNDYTTSYGISLSDVEGQLTNVRRVQELFGNLKDMLGFLEGSIGSADGSEAEDKYVEEYIDEFMLPYIDTVDSFTEEFAKVQSGVDEEAMQRMLYAYALMNTYESYETGNSLLEGMLLEATPAYFLHESTMALIKGAGKTLSIASTALDSYSFLAVMAIQGEAISAPILRMAQIADDVDVERALAYVVNAMDAQTKENIENYETIVNAVRQSNTVNTLLVKPIVSAAVKALNAKVVQVTRAAISSEALATGSTLIGITSWCADAALGLKQTCKKTYELLTLEDLIDQAVAVYRSDLKIYQANPNDEAAKNVIDDLMLLQKMRLRGETIAYKMIVNQMDSAIGKLLGGGATLDYHEALYHTMVDALIGASVLVMPTQEIIIEWGETLTLDFNDEGEVYGLMRSDTRTYVLAEFARTTMSGLAVEAGGTIIIGKKPSEDPACVRYLPIITNRGGEIDYRDNAIRMTEYQQDGGTLRVRASVPYDIPTFTITAGRIVDDATLACSLDIVDFKSKGEVDCGGVPLCVSGNAAMTGTLSNTDVILDGSTQQILSAATSSNPFDLSLDKLSIQNTSAQGVLVAGDVLVTQQIDNIASKLVNGQKITLTGTILGDVFHGGITLDSVQIPANVQIDGLTYLKNNVSATNASFLSSVVLSSGSFVAEGAVTVKQDLNLRGNQFAVSDTLYLGGDIYDLTQDATLEASIGTLVCEAQHEQTIACALSLEHFINHNPSLDGVRLVEDVSVTQSISSLSSKVQSDAKLKVYETTQFADDKLYADVALMQSIAGLPCDIYGDVTVLESTQEEQVYIDVSAEVNLHGDLCVARDTMLTLNAPMSISGDLQIADVAVMIEGTEEAELRLRNLTNKGKLTGNQNATIIGDFFNYNAVDTKGVMTLYGDICNRSTLHIENLQLITKLDKFILGSDFSVDHLTMVGDKSLRVQPVVTVNDTLVTDEVRIVPANNIVCNGSTAVKSTVYQNTVYAKGDFIVESGERVVIRGGLIASGDVIVQEGASLEITKQMQLTATGENLLQIEENGKLLVGGYAIVKTGEVVIDGALQAQSDIVLDADAVSGAGQLMLFADLNCVDAGMDQIGTLVLCGKAPQEIKGAVSAVDLILQNTTRSGITIQDGIYYSGSLEDVGCILKGTVSQK